MIAIANFFNSYDQIQIESHNQNVYDYTLNKDYSYSSFIVDPSSIIFPIIFPLGLMKFIGFPGVLLLSYFTPSIYNSSEIYLNDKCIGFYYKNSINEEDKSVKYDLSLYDKSVLPENFDFHFEENTSGTKFKKSFFSGIGILYNQKMIIDPIFKETEDLNQSRDIADL